MKNSIGISLAVCLALVIWMAAGMVSEGEGTAGQSENSATDGSSTDNRVLVEVTPMQAEEITSYILSNGSITPDREVVVRAETAGQIEDILVEEGAYVEANSVIMRLELDDRQIREEQAEINVQEKQRLYDAAANLLDRNFASQSEVDNALTQLKLAEVELERIRLEIEKTFIRAPFAGFIEENIVDVGEYVSIGNEMIRLVDNDPLVVTAHISQNDVDYLSVGTEAIVELINGNERRGQVRFISPRANESTRTFRVEIAVPNTDGLRSGSSVTARIPRRQVMAHYISAGLLTLNEEGDIGLKTIDPEGRVAFHEITIERSDVDGMWVSGLPQQAQVITAGQGFAPIGESVRMTMNDSSIVGKHHDYE
ncbi:MAG: efflux transporter periplasmic adaptor subunit [Gammaproteobacteria bacterium]|nr:efflux transporter periplasmic adaptor subunit [Gammaproteobacteria bacterium]